MSFVKIIHINRTTELNAIVHARHPDATVININSLFVSNGLSATVDRECALRVIPFLSRFPKLQLASFSSQDVVLGRLSLSTEDINRLVALFSRWLLHFALGSYPTTPKSAACSVQSLSVG